MSSGRRGLSPASAGALYFGLVFAAGFALGVLRELVLLPRLGERWAELVEMPLMLAVCFLAARVAVRRLHRPATGRRLATGSVALALLLFAEAAVVVFLFGETLRQGFLERDPVSRTAYWVSLALFAALPLVVERGDRDAQ